MKVLITGANGFLGSHVLDRLLDTPGFEVTILLRSTSDTRFIAHHLDGKVTTYRGSLSDGDVVERAVADVDVIVHCAAKTKTLRESEYFAVNRDGTENIVRVAGARGDALRHFILISSLAVSGPGTLENPAEETTSPRPLTAYARSKRDAETVVQRMDRVPWTILRPAAIYGPRDVDFLPLFRSVKRGFAPLPRGGRQPLSVVYGPDVAEAVRCCLDNEQAVGKVYHVAAATPTDTAGLAHAIATAMNRRTHTLSIPGAVLYLACMLQGLISQLQGKPHILNRHKWPELSAPGWVCATDRLRDDVGFEAATSLETGIMRTLEWYSQRRWV